MVNADLIKVQSLVGEITESDLRYVDYYVSSDIGIFIPSVGFCQYAITYQHIHPSYSFILFPFKEQSMVNIEMEVPQNKYLSVAIGPDIPHEEKSENGFSRYMAIFIKKSHFDEIYKRYASKAPKKYNWKQFLVNKSIMLYLKRFMSEYENKLIGYEEVLDSLSKIIVHQIIRDILHLEKEDLNYIESNDIENIIEYIHQNYGEKLVIGELSTLINMSESHFIRKFKKEMDVTPMEYIINLRIEKAKKLLRSGTKNITEIALQCGFNSASHFSASFQKQMGRTPTEYQSDY
ncbi:MAG: helix-turn-helix domain-containing protein [Eubacteriales bacterium]